jgi:hypothetical protein
MSLVFGAAGGTALAGAWAYPTFALNATVIVAARAKVRIAERTVRVTRVSLI